MSQRQDLASTSHYDEGMVQGIKEEIGTEMRIQQQEHKYNKRGNSYVYTTRIRYVCEKVPKLTGKTAKKRKKKREFSIINKLLQQFVLKMFLMHFFIFPVCTSVHVRNT